MSNKAKSKDDPKIVSTLDRPRIIDPQFQEIVDGVHGDPHHVLGAHVDGPTAVVRAFRPDARAAKVLLVDGTSVGMERVHAGGIFEATVPSKALGEDRLYRVETTYQNGDVSVLDDPYRFWPTVGDLDLYLFGQGRHEHLWRMLGAHLRTHQGATGVSFAVWAPNARSVRLAGEFNFWQGRMHPMRRLGSSGVWELFVPGITTGTQYKFEILEPGGRVVQRADPFAFATEVPPRTGSVVYDSKHQWSDEEWLERRSKTDLHNAPFSVYEVHLGSWRRKGDDGSEFLSYRELAEQLCGTSFWRFMGLPSVVVLRADFAFWVG
jgi:1,4-alpha-glucan branching enzyme